MSSLSHALIGGWHAAALAAVKVTALFLTAVLVLRLTERRTLAEFAPFDWVAAVAVGAIVGRTATSVDTSWLTGATALVTLLALHSVLARLRFIGPVRRLLDPPLRVLIHDGVVDARNLRRCGVTREDLAAILRQHGFTDPSDIHLAIFEAKGAVSVLPAGDAPAHPPGRGSGG